jgi:hypothetical protein
LSLKWEHLQAELAAVRVHDFTCGDSNTAKSLNAGQRQDFLVDDRFFSTPIINRMQMHLQLAADVPIYQAKVFFFFFFFFF